MSSSLLQALLALQPLHDLPRTGWILRGIAAQESIGAHVLGTQFVVMALGPRIVPRIDTERALALALLHDVPEAWLGDLPRTAAGLFPPGVKAQAEDRAAEELLPPLAPLALERWREFRANTTREARFVRVCDRLQLGVRLVGHHRLGVRGLDDFEATVAGLDCSEFAPAAELQREILVFLREDGPRARAGQAP
jgi:putative hydrolase of HD superfamily